MCGPFFSQFVMDFSARGRGLYDCNFHCPLSVWFLCHSLVGCPYSDVNLSRENLLQDRLSGERPAPGNVQKARRVETPGPLLGAGESSQGDSSQSR